MRENNWRSRNLVLAGNFNLTNVEEQFHKLIELGQHPKDFSDTVTVLEKIGHFLDEENQQLFDKFKNEGHPVHRTLLDAGIVIIEGLYLNEVPPGDYELLCLSLKIKDGDAAPARVFLREV